MKNSNQITPRSPKNRFRIDFRYNKALEGIGSVSSFGMMNIDHLEENEFFREAKNRGSGSYSVWENKEEYPKFDWELLKTVNF